MFEDQNSVLGRAVFEEKPLPINDRDAKLEQLDAQMAEITNRIDTLENSGVDAEAREDITEINELLGDDELETEAQTITGAINELKSNETDPVTVNDTLTSTSATEALSAKQGKILKDDLDTHKADNAAHNGFVGQYKGLPNFTDFNELTTPGVYHGVISEEKLNEAVIVTGLRRLALQVTVNTTANVYQELYYQDGVSSIRHRRFYRQRTNATDWLPWFEIKTSRDIERGQGSPEGVISARVGTLYQRTDGGAGTTLYVKESGTGNTGWKAVQTS